MGAVLQCLFRVCCHGGDEEEEEDEHHQSASHEHPVNVPSASSSLLSANHHHHSINDGRSTRPSCQTPPQPEQDHEEIAATRSNNTLPRRGVLFRLFRPRFAKIPHVEHEERKSRSMNSPLRTAGAFHSTGSYPTLSPHEIVLPGSKLQHEMAHMMHLRQMQDGTNHHPTEECVICLEGFDESNPRMPTQCGCGTNQTYFHLPCLYQWLEQSEECPTCRQTITWHEFC